MFKVAFEISEYNKAKAAGRVNGVTLINRRVDAATITVYGIENKFGVSKTIWQLIQLVLMFYKIIVISFKSQLV